MSLMSLPLELRTRIWSLAVEPRRIMNVRIKKKLGERFSNKQRRQGKDILYEASSTPPPALMHVCHESRRYAPYQRAFTAGTEPRWTWVNFELDIFCVNSLYAIHDLVSHRHEVQRLRIRPDDHHQLYESATTYGALKILDEFVNLKEIRVVLSWGKLFWGDVFMWHCSGYHPRENIEFVDEGSGLVHTGPQLKLVGDWHTVFSFDREGNPPEPDRLQEEIEFALDDLWHLTMAQMYEIE
ncbi:hypothetical protein B0I35DRAFT_446125 [Stachybotrys elegans]|uniref:2EXR domain-containing protein n=1 Tax=Stachybotrys elegans TaxID=80388 RepID=A0A8K0SEG6_9HYPO|nr:hypothetical protein B0I35DRAFT_446125 [Stachybotrys elegans]